MSVPTWVWYCGALVGAGTLATNLLFTSAAPPPAAPALAAPVARLNPAVPAEAVAPARLESLSRAYLGVPYVLDCLGEGKGKDEDPLFTREAADCQTLVEQVMAEAIAPWVGGLDSAIRTTRYNGGEIGFENRYHYCIPDWLDNPWPVRDITSSLRPGLPTLERKIDLPGFLAGRGGDPKQSPEGVRTVKGAYVPRADVADVLDKIPDGSIAVWVLDQPGIVSGHLGFVFRRNGDVMFRHASQTRKKVIDEPLLTYAKRAPKRFMGLQVLQPDVRGLDR